MLRASTAEPLELHLTMADLMADLDPGWLPAPEPATEAVDPATQGGSGE